MAAVASSSEENRTLQVFLKTDSKRYLPFVIELSQIKLVLVLKVAETQNKVRFEHYFDDLHVHTCDTAIQKASDNRLKHYCLLLEHKNAHQVLYFIDFATMTEAADAIVRHQGFQSRFTQYKQKAELRSFFFGDRFLVRHIISRQIYELRSISNLDYLQSKVFVDNFIKFLQKEKIKHTQCLVDIFKDADDQTVLVLERLGALTLQ